MNKPQWRDVGVNFSGSNQAMANAQKGISGAVAGAESILNRINTEEAKKVEQQRLADALALQQQEAKNLAAYREEQLGLQRESNELAYDKQLETEAQALRGDVTNKYMSDILASKNVAEAQTKLAKYRNDAMFSPDSNAQKLLSSYLNPAPTEYKGDKYYKALDGGGYTVVDARSAADEEALIKAGYLRGNPEGTGSGKSSSGGTDSGKTTGELALYKAIGGLGNENTVYKAVEAARAANVPFNVINNWVAAKGGYNPETGLLELDWGKRDIDVSDLNKMTEEFRKKADTSLGSTKDGASEGITNTSADNDNVFINTSEVARKGLGDLARSFGLGNQEQVPSATGIEQGSTLAQNRAAIEDSDIKELFRQASSGSVSPLLNDTSASPKQRVAAIQKLKDIRLSNPYEFDKKYPGLAEKYLYNQ